MKFKELGVQQLVETVASCYEKLKDKLEKICRVESHFGIIALKGRVIQSVSLNELGECDDLFPFCAQCAFVYKNARYSIFFGLNNYSIINTFGRIHNEYEDLQEVNIMFTSAFRPKTMNSNLVEGYKDFLGGNQKIYSYGYVFNCLDIDEFRLIDAHDLTESEHILYVFERIENFAELYFVQIMEAMQDDEFISKLEHEQKKETELLPLRKRVPNTIKLNLAFNSFCKGNYRDASNRLRRLENILTQYEKRRLHFMDFVLANGKQPPVIENDIFNYVEKGKAAVRNESKYTFYSILIAYPVTFLSSLLIFLFCKNMYFGRFSKDNALLILEPEAPFFIILALFAGTVLLFPGVKIAMQIFFRNLNDKLKRQIDTYIKRAKLWPDGAVGYFLNAVVIIILFGFALLVNNNSVFYRDKMVISNGNLRGISANTIDYSEIEGIYKVTRVKREDKIYEGWRIFYLLLKDKRIVRAENVFTSKYEFIDKGLPIILKSTKKELVEVGLFDEILYLQKENK